MGFEPLRRNDAVNGAVVLQHDLAFRKVEIEWPTRLPLAFERRVGGVERFQYWIDQRPSYFIRASADRSLRLRVVQFCGRTHQHSVECMRMLASVAADDHADRKGRAILMSPKRTKVVGNTFGQHRHD